VRDLVVHGQIHTTYARAKAAQRVADRLVTLGKDGSIHSRRRALRILQDRDLVKRLFAEIAPRYLDVAGGYTRVLRLSLRRGDGAQLAVLALSRLPALQAAARPEAKPAHAPQPPGAPERPQPKAPEPAEKPKGLFEGLRHLWTRKKKGAAAH
jgi:large subunit ribosomal protein L17